MAHVLGYPTCDTERFVTDPEFGTLLPNASYLVPKTNLTPPMEQYTNMYPFHVLPHYESLNSGNIPLRSPIVAFCSGMSLLPLSYCRPAAALSQGSVIYSRRGSQIQVGMTWNPNVVF